MRYFPLLIVLLAGAFSLSPLFAQGSSDAISVPNTVKTNCLLTQSGTIDFCPEYRADVRDTNTKLYQRWMDAETKGQINLYDTINTDIASFRSEAGLKTKQSLSGAQLFLREYEEYLTNLFTKFFNENTNKSHIVSNFFKTTYFNTDQSGLGISQLSLYTKTPEKFDQSIILQLSVRNFTANQISNIEDVYCFSTINNQDYIYPMNIKPTFSANSISNLIIELKPGISPLFEKVGQKKIACTIVYTQFGETKYTNRGTLTFDITQ